ncbi:hypothetical protein Chor_015123, partial [Crotalus horridus]
CSFLPKFSIYIETKYEDNCGNSTNIFPSEKILGDHEVMFLDIAFDEIPDRYYSSLEDNGFPDYKLRRVIRDILLIGHRQAFAWVDEWCGMTMDEVRLYEKETQQATNEIVGIVTPTISISVHLPPSTQSAPSSAPSTPLSGEAPEFLHVPKDRQRKKSAPEMLSLPVLRERSNLE